MFLSACSPDPPPPAEEVTPTPISTRTMGYRDLVPLPGGPSQS